MNTVKHEYIGEEKLSNLGKTTITHPDGTETVVTYRKEIGGELMGEPTLINQEGKECSLEEELAEPVEAEEAGETSDEELKEVTL